MANTNIRLNQIQSDGASGGQFLKFNGTNWLPASTISDDIFTIVDNSDDTKQAVFQVSGISTATTRTFTFPDANGTLALTSDLFIATGTTGYFPKWASSGELTDSIMFETSNTVSIGYDPDMHNYTRFYVYGGAQGANLDVRGEAGSATDQAVLDLQPSDFATSFSSFVFKMGGPTLVGTIEDGIPNANLMQIIFGYADNYLVRMLGTTPLRFYADHNETLRITSSGIEVRGGHELRLFDSDNTHHVAIKTPATGTLTSNYTLTLPANDGNSGEVLSTDGSGVLSWITPSSGGITGSGVAGNLAYWSATGTVDDISIGTSNQILGVTNAGGAHEYKTIQGTSNRVTVTHGTNTVTLSAPQDLHSGATPQFASLQITAAAPFLTVENTTTNSSLGGGRINLTANDGTTMLSGERLGSIYYTGYATTALRTGVRFEAFASETWTDSANGSYFSIFTTANGTNSQVEQLRVEQDGDLSLRLNNGLKLFNTGNTFSFKIVAPSALSADYTMILPDNMGSSGQVLSTNGTNTLSWITPTSATNLSYTASTRTINSDTGSDATLPLMSTSEAGLVPASGGGTTNFLRADGTWAAPLSGDVVGPASAVNNRVVFFDGTTGKLIKDSGLTLSGSNTGDQTTIVGITGTKAQFNTALTDGDFMFVGDTPTAHTLDSHSNVTITDNLSGEILKWNGTAWINNTLAEAGIQPAGSYLTANQTITLSGDITGSGATAITTTIANDAVTYAKLQNVAANSFLANLSGSAVNVQEISTTRIPLFAGAITGTPSSSTYLRGDGAWAVAPVDGNGIYTGSGLITTDTTVSIAATKSFYIEHTNTTAPAFAIEDTGNVSLYSPNSNHILSLTNSGVAITPDLTRQFKFNTTGFEMSDATNTWSVFLLASNSMSADYTLTLPVNDGNSGQVLSTNGSGVLSWSDVSGGGLVDGDYGDIVVSLTGTTMTVDTGVISNDKLATGVGGFYKGSGTIAPAASATLTSSSSFSINYASGGNSGLSISDNLNSAYIQSKDATQYFYTDNTSSLIGSGGTYLEYIDGVLRFWDSDVSQYVGIQPPATGFLTTSYTLTLPTTDGNSGDLLTTNGAGGLSWTPLSLPSGDVVGTTDTQTLTNKRIDPRVSVTTSSSTPTPNVSTDDMYILTAQSVTATFGAPTGSPVQGQKLIIRVKDNGTARSLSFNAIYRPIGLTLPTTTIPNKTLYFGLIYNSTDTKWDIVAISQEL